MKSVGIVRKLDDIGRLVIPIELRRTMGIEEKDPMEIFIDEEKVILKKYESACVFCGNAFDTQHFHGKIVCRECAGAIYKNAKAM